MKGAANWSDLTAPGYLESAGWLQVSQKKVLPNSVGTTLKPVGMASTLKSKVRFSGRERWADPDIPQFEHVSNSIHWSLMAIMRADSPWPAAKTACGAAGVCSELLTFRACPILRFGRVTLPYPHAGVVCANEGRQVKLGWLQKLSLRGDGCQLDAQCRDLLKQIKALGTWREHASRFQ
jgi:hypothetical protein